MAHVVEGEDGDGHTLHEHTGAEGLGDQVSWQAGDNAAAQVRSPVEICDKPEEQSFTDTGKCLGDQGSRQAGDNASIQVMVISIWLEIRVNQDRHR